MRIIATIEADFTTSPLGLPSRLADDLLGETILRRTLKRVLSAQRVDRTCLVVHRGQESTARQAAAGLDVAVETHDTAGVPWRDLTASARKWSLDAWRGGLLGLTVFDESLNPWVLDALARREQADGVVSVHPAAVLLDPALLDRMIGHYEQVREQMRMTFTQSAPGLSAAIYRPDFLTDLAQYAQSTGRIMAYRPADPRNDMVMQSCFYPPDAAVTYAAGRCLADTRPAIDRIAAIRRELGEDPDATTVSRWLTQHRYDEPPSLPAEVEVELTTDDPLPESTLRPRGSAVDRRGPMDAAVFDRLLEELASREDVRIVLGGFGDPLRHPEWRRFVQSCREAGIFALAIRTPAVELDAAAIETLIEQDVDVLNVLLDAYSAETYTRLHRAHHYDRVIANLDHLLAVQQQRNRPRPIVAPEMIKTHATMNEMEGFYDHWLNRTGAAVLAGPSHYAGQWHNLAVMSMAPPSRFPCQQIFHRCTVLADGRVTACDQDFRGQHTVGSLAEHRLTDLWTGPAMAALRRSHRAATCDAIPLCPACDEWHRP